MPIDFTFSQEVEDARLMVRDFRLIISVSRPRTEDPALLPRVRELRPQHFEWLREQGNAGVSD